MGRPAKPIDESSYGGRFAANLRRRRERKKLEPEDAARATGVSKQAWYHWESAHHFPSIELLPAIAKVLGCSPRQLIPER